MGGFPAANMPAYSPPGSGDQGNPLQKLLDLLKAEKAKGQNSMGGPSGPGQPQGQGQQRPQGQLAQPSGQPTGHQGSEGRMGGVVGNVASIIGAVKHRKDQEKITQAHAYYSALLDWSDSTNPDGSPKSSQQMQQDKQKAEALLNDKKVSKMMETYQGYFAVPDEPVDPEALGVHQAIQGHVQKKQGQGQGQQRPQVNHVLPRRDQFPLQQQRGQLQQQQSTIAKTDADTKEATARAGESDAQAEEAKLRADQIKKHGDAEALARIAADNARTAESNVNIARTNMEATNLPQLQADQHKMANAAARRDIADALKLESEAGGMGTPNERRQMFQSSVSDMTKMQTQVGNDLKELRKRKDTIGGRTIGKRIIGALEPDSDTIETVDKQMKAKEGEFRKITDALKWLQDQQKDAITGKAWPGDLLNQAYQMAGTIKTSGEVIGDAPAGAPEGAENTLDDGTPVVIKGGKITVR